MGTWGTALYSDDLAADLRGDFKDLVGEGRTAEEALDRLLADYEEPIRDPDERAVFWLAVADTAWRLGRPLARATAEANAVIRSGRDLQRWESQAERKKRSTVLIQLEERLRTDPPPPRKVPRRFVPDNQWAVGEVLSFRLLSGRYALFRVIGHHRDKGGRHAVCEVLDWIGDDLPGEADARRLTIKDRLYPSGRPQFLCGEPRRKAELDRFARTGWTLPPAQTPSQYSVFVFPYFDQQLREGFGIE